MDKWLFIIAAVICAVLSGGLAFVAKLTENEGWFPVVAMLCTVGSYLSGITSVFCLGYALVIIVSKPKVK